MSILRRLVGVFCVAVFLATGCSSQEASSDQEALEQLLQELQTAVKDEDAEKIAALTESLLPDEESLRVALVDDDTIQALRSKNEAALEEFSTATDEEKLDSVGIDADQTEIIVKAATTEELVAANNGGQTVEFPGGALDNADLLKPGTTFYEIDFLKPGEELGLVYHMAYHDGKNWKLLGPFWNVVPA